MKPEIIAFYLPQFHPMKENDEWWGKGFTEWTNVGKAKPLFKGHNQPRVPTELGYYDLRMPEVRQQQAELAKEAGVTAFCYWHYWLGNGKRLMPEVFDEVLNSGNPDFPFCLGWANHSWYAKNWNADGTTTQNLLIEQTYPGEEDAKMHFDYLLKAFKDQRYVKIDGAPLLYIFRPYELPQQYVELFRKWTKEAGFPDLFIVGTVCSNKEKAETFKKGYDAVVYMRIGGQLLKSKVKGQYHIWKLYRRLKSMFFRRPPFMTDYKDNIHNLIQEVDYEDNVLPEIMPQWDHTPRSGWNGTLFVNATPENFYLHVKDALNAIKNKPDNRKIIFLKSWNEWGEGNMMEPDITYGKGFINALRKAIDDMD